MADTVKKRGRPAKRARKKPVRGDKLVSSGVLKVIEPPEHKKFSAWQLRKLGYTVDQTAQILCIGTTSVKNWDKEIDKYFEDLPAVRTATDTITSMIPRALSVYEKGLDSSDPRVARDTARDILISTKALKDRQTVETIDDASSTDTDLIAEAERIMLIAGSKVAAGSDND